MTVWAWALCTPSCCRVRSAYVWGATSFMPASKCRQRNTKASLAIKPCFSVRYVDPRGMQLPSPWCTACRQFSTSLGGRIWSEHLQERKITAARACKKCPVWNPEASSLWQIHVARKMASKDTSSFMQLARIQGKASVADSSTFRLDEGCSNDCIFIFIGGISAGDLFTLAAAAIA